MNFRSYKMTVTPDQAKEWLNANVHNRPLSNAVVAKYIEDMKAGNWKLNGEPIIFSTKRKLLNGQHRLYACIEADVAFEAVVTEGIDEDTFDTIDTGKGRTGGDILSIAGFSGNHNYLAAATGLVMAYKSGTLHLNRPRPKHEMLRFVQENLEIVEWVSRCKTHGWTSAYSSLLAALGFLASYRYPHKVQEFIDKFHTGAALEHGCPVLALRNRLGSEKNIPRMDRFALIVTAWNAYAKNKNLVKVNSPRSGEFPTIEGAQK